MSSAPRGTRHSKALHFRCSRPSGVCAVGSGSRLRSRASTRWTRCSRASASTVRTSRTPGRISASRSCPPTTCSCGPEYREPVARVLLVLGLMAAAALLAGWANLATRLLARGVERRRELGARALELARRVGGQVLTVSIYTRRRRPRDHDGQRRNAGDERTGGSPHVQQAGQPVRGRGTQNEPDQATDSRKPLECLYPFGNRWPWPARPSSSDWPRGLPPSVRLPTPQAWTR